MTPSELRARYSWLAGIPDTTLQAWLAVAADRYSGDHGLRERLIELWVLCQLVSTTPELRSTWAVQSESISAQGRSVSVTYADVGAANWFCAELERLERALALGGWVA